MQSQEFGKSVYIGCLRATCCLDYSIWKCFMNRKAALQSLPPNFRSHSKKLLAFFWKSKHSPAAPFHSIYLLFLGLCDTLGMTNASRLTPWVVNCHISDSLSLLLMLLLHHSEGLVRKHTLISPVHALSDAQSMNQWPSFHEKHPMRPHFMYEIGEGSDRAIS